MRVEGEEVLISPSFIEPISQHFSSRVTGAFERARRERNVGDLFSLRRLIVRFIALAAAVDYDSNHCS